MFQTSVQVAILASFKKVKSTKFYYYIFYYKPQNYLLSGRNSFCREDLPANRRPQTTSYHKGALQSLINKVIDSIYFMQCPTTPRPEAQLRTHTPHAALPHIYSTQQKYSLAEQSTPATLVFNKEKQFPQIVNISVNNTYFYTK